MKATLILMLGLAAFVSLNAQSSKTASAAKPQDTHGASKTTAIVGVVSGDEKNFVTDKDNKVWTVTNPAALKGHAGHHVSVAVQADATQDGFTVKSVKELTPSAGKTPKALENNDDRLRVPPPQRTP